MRWCATPLAAQYAHLVGVFLWQARTQMILSVMAEEGCSSTTAGEVWATAPSYWKTSQRQTTLAQVRGRGPSGLAECP
jgi:hypothetical protein